MNAERKEKEKKRRKRNVKIKECKGRWNRDKGKKQGQIFH